MSRTAWAAGIVLGAALVGCDREAKAPSAAAQVVEDVVREAARHVPADPDDAETLPVVYVVSHSEEPFSARVQAAVASAVNGEIDVRFADARDEALDAERPGQPVRDRGALVAIGPLTLDDPPMVVELEIYRSETQFSRRTVTFARAGDDWSPTSSSVLEEVEVPTSTSPAGDGDAGDADGDADDESDAPVAGTVPSASGPAPATTAP